MNGYAAPPPPAPLIARAAPRRRRMNDEVEFASSRVALNWRGTVRRRAITSAACEVQREQLK